MFKRAEDPIKKALDAQILDLFRDMTDADAYDEDYQIMASTVTKLYELRQKERVSMDAVIAAVTHLAGLAVVLQHERVHVIASKAFGLIKKIV